VPRCTVYSDLCTSIHVFSLFTLTLPTCVHEYSLYTVTSVQFLHYLHLAPAVTQCTSVLFTVTFVGLADNQIECTLYMYTVTYELERTQGKHCDTAVDGFDKP
jgi:hypothetical protein